jgi:hypothetical protein
MSNWRRTDRNIKNREPMKLTKVVLPLNKESKVNRIYKLDHIEGDHLPILKEMVSEGKLIGELGHSKTLDIKFTKASHKISKIWIDKKNENLMADIITLKTKYGEVIEQRPDNFVFRPRMIGSVNEETKEVDIKTILTIDAIPKDQDVF